MPSTKTVHLSCFRSIPSVSVITSTHVDRHIYTYQYYRMDKAGDMEV